MPSIDMALPIPSARGYRYSPAVRELAQARPRFGYARFHVLLRREGWVVNKKRVHRIYGEEGLSVRLTHRRKRVSHLRVVPSAPSLVNERWSMDFVADTLLDGRRFRALTVVDNYSRHSQIIEPDFTLTGTKVVAALERVAKRTGYPHMITVDNVLYAEVKRATRTDLLRAV